MLVHWSIGPLVECQMLNVNKVKLLSDRTSRVPPVIFVFEKKKNSFALNESMIMHQIKTKLTKLVLMLLLKMLIV